MLTEGGSYCAMHSGKVDPRELGRKGGIASMAARQERAKHVRERLPRRVGQRFEEVAGALFDALGSDDERLRVRAATALLAETYGNPATAIVGDVDKPVTFLLESAFNKRIVSAAVDRPADDRLLASSAVSAFSAQPSGSRPGLETLWKPAGGS